MKKYLNELFTNKRLHSMLWFMFASIVATFITNLQGDPFTWTWAYVKAVFVAAIVFNVTKAWSNYKAKLVSELEDPELPSML